MPQDIDEYYSDNPHLDLRGSQPPPPPCPANSRKVTATVCLSGLGAIWGCITVNGGLVPQVGQLVDSGTFSPTPQGLSLIHI